MATNYAKKHFPGHSIHFLSAVTLQLEYVPAYYPSYTNLLLVHFESFRYGVIWEAGIENCTDNCASLPRLLNMPTIIYL